jgi:hypothetical protein
MTTLESAYGVPPKRKRSRGKHTAPRHAFDRRTRIGKRAIALARAFRERLADAAADPIVSVHIEKAARLTAYAEQLAARALNDDPRVTADDVIRAARASDLALRRAGLHDRPLRRSRGLAAAPSGAPSLADVLAEINHGESGP